MLRTRFVVGLTLLLTGLFTATAHAGWQRVQRVSVYDSEQRARYPSLGRGNDGSLLVVFTRQTAEQEANGRGDLMLARSEDQGQTWSDATVIYADRAGEPRAAGKMTRLKSGDLILPVAVFGTQQTTCQVRMFVSADSGKSWKSLDATFDVPLHWWAPRGSLIETSNGLVMPIYGAATEDSLRRTVHNCALLRSLDGGTSWGDFSWIARGPAPMIGAAATSRFSFEGPSVVVLPDGRWLAMVTARRLNKSGDGPGPVNEGPGTPHVLCRLWSSDQGRTWTKPDHLMPGAWPGLAVVGEYTLCANTNWSAWGNMRLEVSRNGFQTVSQQVRMTTREWLRGMTNRPQETPAPPTVPYLADGWPFEHYGYPSVLPLDKRNVVVVFTDQKRGTYQIDGPDSRNIPYDLERIRAVFYRLDTTDDRLASAPSSEPKRPHGRWVLAERMVVPNLGNMAQLPGGDLIAKVSDTLSRSSDGGRTWRQIEGATLPEDLSTLAVLKSGRWLAAKILEKQQWKSSGGGPKKVGSEGGYPTFKLSGESYDTSIVMRYSDDEGKTWQTGKPFKGPFKWVLPAGKIFEGLDGTLAFPIFGCVTEEEMSSYSASNGVIRSRDDGRTWGDFSFVFRTQPKGPKDYQPEPRYSSVTVVPLLGGDWVACSRNERISMGPAGWGSNDLAISKDFGRSWEKTGGSLVGVSQQKGFVLPDGGLAMTWRATSWQAPGAGISYDGGRSFDYLLTGPYETVNAFVTGKDEFVIFTKTSNRSDSSAGIYRWLPGE